MTDVLNLAQMKGYRASLPAQNTLALVPTMGALHEGHLALIELAKQRAQTVVVSIFVNPLQFGPDEDYERYPRQLEQDVRKLEAAGVDAIFTPTVAEMYPIWPPTTTVNAGEAGRILEGEHRPGHFDGVLTVVAKLFQIVRPNIAVFGQKDAQQLALVRRMVSEFKFGIEIVAQPIVRDHDGLALSSRNVYIKSAQRDAALTLSRALRAAAHAQSASEARAAAYAVYEGASGVEVDYFELVNPETFSIISEGYKGDVIGLTAARIGQTRLIDNLSFTV